MGKKYDSYGVREEEVIYLAQPGKKVVCALGSVDRTTVSLEDKLNDISELTFEIDKYYNGEPVPEYDWVDQHMLLYVDGIWFKIKEQPIIKTEDLREYKEVTAMSLETELQQYLLVGFKVNQGTVDSIEKIYQDEHELDSFQQVRFYNKDIPELSLVDAILAYANVPDWKIGYVDDITIGTEADLNGEYKTLPYEVAGFDVESQDVYSFLTQDVSKTFSCMFQFDTENKLINVYRVDAVGYDTNIILGFRNLQNSLEVSCDTELYTSFEVRGDEDMTIDYVNFGTSQIEDISFFLDIKYMPQELIDKYNAWVEYRESRRTEYIELSGEYNTFLNTISEIMYRVPTDGVENDWTTYEEDDLKLALDNYNAMVTQLEHLYVDDHGNFDLEALKNSTDWELYKQMVDYIIPSIKAALQKQGVDTSANGTGNLFKNVNPVITLNWQTITEDVLTPVDIEEKPCNGIIRGIQVQSNGGFYQAVNGFVIDESYTISAYVKCEGSGTVSIGIKMSGQDMAVIKSFSVTNKWIRVDASFTALAKYYQCYFTFGEGNYVVCGMQLERGTLHDFGYFAGLGNETDILSAWETDWNLYGTIELKNKLDSYKNAVEALKENGFDSPYYEGSSYSWEYHTKMYQKYNDYLSLIDDCQKAYDERCAELKVQEDKRDELAKKRQKIAYDVQKENFGSVQEAYLGFTDDELSLLRTFINQTDYVNENIVLTTLDTEKEKVSQQYDLYLKAKERLYIESHPQYIYSDTVDNLYALPEFKEYHEDLKVGNFLWIEDSEEHFVKLRVVTIKYNPCTWDNDITIEFSNMVQGQSRRDDIPYIIQSAIESTRNQIIGTTNNRDITSYTITSEFIRQLLKNPIMGNAISNGGSNAIASMTGQIDFLVSKAIKTEKITAEVVDAVTGNFQKIFTTYIEGDLASFNKTVTDFLMAGQIITDDVKAATGTFTNYLTGVKILGDLLEVNTVIAEKILLRGSDKSVVYQLNQLGELTTEMVENIEQYQFDAGKTIIADSITSREINVNDLWVTGIANMLNANIGTALINDLTALTSHLGTWYFHESIIEGDYGSMLIGGYLQSKNYAENNGVVTAGCKIDLNNFAIDSPNFKISPSGNVEMTGTLAVGSKVSMGSVYDENGTPLEDVLNTIGTSINLHSKDGQVFTESASVITPDSITVNAVCDGDVTVAKWLIDDVENTEYVAADKMSITIPSSYMANKKQIVVKAQNADGTVYDYITLCRLTDGANGINGIDGENGFFYIAYSANSNGNPMTSEPQADTKYMGVYSGVENETITDYTKFKWTLIRGNDGINGIAGKDGKTYYTWIKYATSSNPTSMSDTPDGMDYIGIAYNKETSEGSNNPNDYAWSLLRGAQGIQGIPGEDGEQLYTWIKYADTPTTGMSDAPENKDYMGIAYNKTTVTESNNYSDYQWIYIRGEQGIQGEKGENGIDGKTSYFHIKYSSVSNPTSASQITETPSAYIGTYVDFSSTDSTDPSKYTWSRFEGVQGAKGDQGIPGTNGTNGKTSYLHIAYANSSDGKTGFSVSDSTNKSYIGQYTDFTSADSTDYTKYTWSLIKGADGKTPVKGVDYFDGVSSYLWIRYATDANGSGMTATPSNTTKYIGTASTTTSTAPTSASAYKWSKYVGENGAKGANGYIHIAYANSADGISGFDTTIGANKKYIGQYTDNIEADSTDPTKYTWTLIKGETGAQGIQGLQGEKGEQGIPGIDGKTSYFHIKYSSVAKPTSSSQITETPSTYIGTYVDFTQADSTDPTKYTWSRFEGIQGQKGDQGIPGTNGSDGKTSYLHIAYADSSDGKTNFSVSDATNKMYIGQYTDFTQADSTDYTKYTWTKIKGEQGIQGIQGIQGEKGEQGIPGTDGSDGKSSYLHIKYSNDGGKTFTSANGETLGTWVGTYVDQNSTDSSNVSDYKWKKFVGEDGESGIGYTVVLSNENHGFVADGNGVVQAEQIQIKISAWKNISAIATTVTIPELPTGMTATVSNNGTTNTYVTINVNSSLTDTKGTVGFSITADGVNFTKIFSWSVNRGGKDGKPGRVYSVDSSSTSAVYNIRNGECTPSSVSFNAYYSDGDSKEKLTLDCYMQISYTSTGSTWIKYGDRLHCTNGTTAFNFLSTSHLDGLPVNTETGIITAVKCEIFATETSNTAYASKELAIIPSMNEIAVLGFVEENNTIYVDGSNFYAGSIHTSALAAEVIKSIGCEYSSSSVYTTKGTYFDLATGALASQNFAIDTNGNAFFKGEITATSGKLGNWNIGDSSIYYAGDTTYTNDESAFNNSGSMYFGTSGLSLGKKFVYDKSTDTLTVTGNIVANSLTLGSGVTIDADDISGLSSEVSYYVGQSGAIIKGKTYSGNEYSSEDKQTALRSFSVSSNGLLEAQNAIIYGTIYASAGSFTGTVDAKSMTAKDGYYIYKTGYGSMPIIDSEFIEDVDLGEEENVGGSSVMSSSVYRVNIGILRIATGSSSSHYYSSPYLEFIPNSNLNGGKINVCNATLDCEKVYSTKIECSNIVNSNNKSVSWDGHTHSGYATTSQLSNYATTSQLSNYASSSHGHFKLSLGGNGIDLVYAGSQSNGGGSYRFAPYASAGNIDLGSNSPNNCWYNIYTAKSVTTVSDKNLKENFATIDERYEKMFMDLSPSLYMLKGTNGHIPDRVHCGFIAQEVNEAAEKNGLSAETFAAICRDDLDEPTEDGRTETWGLRYHEFHGLEVHMIQKALKRIEKLEAENIKLKDENNSLKERMSVLEGLIALQNKIIL